jgi:hypothetical protein
MKIHQKELVRITFCIYIADFGFIAKLKYIVSCVENSLIVNFSSTSQYFDFDYFYLFEDWVGVKNLVSVLPSSVKRVILVSSIGVTKCNELPWR